MGSPTRHGDGKRLHGAGQGERLRHGRGRFGKPADRKREPQEARNQLEMLMQQVVHDDDDEEGEDEIRDGHGFELVAGGAHLHPGHETEEERGEDLQRGRVLLGEARDRRNEELRALGVTESASCVRIRSPWEVR